MKLFHFRPRLILSRIAVEFVTYLGEKGTVLFSPKNYAINNLDVKFVTDSLTAFLVEFLWKKMILGAILEWNL